MPVEILGALPPPLDAMVREVLHQGLDPRPQEFVIYLSCPHAEAVVHITKPFDQKLKFNSPTPVDAARELRSAVDEIVEEKLGPIP